MSEDKLNKIGVAGAATVGGVTGSLWAGMLTAAEIITVSSPVGFLCGALAFVGLVLSADTNS